MDKKEFMDGGKTLGLTEEELELLWECAGSLKSPEDLFWKREAFEDCLRHIALKKREVINKLQTIRKKLRFEEIPSFLPIKSTQEIEICHPVTVVIKGVEHAGFLWEKGKDSLLVALPDTPKGLEKGDVLEFRMNREGDGRYIFRVRLLDTIRQGQTLLLRVQGTDKLLRIDLREVPRWKADMSAEFETEGVKAEGLIEDISVRGVRLCTEHPCRFGVGTRVHVSFKLKNHPIKVSGIVRNMSMLGDRICMGISFEDIREQDEELIRRWSLLPFK
ncbi:MAG: PilZ domain-containing protein [Aquificaceae bacterium]|nr:PilZ domain-containing protein [Aquificaceae bacterium]